MHLDRRTFLGAMGAGTAASLASPLLAGEAVAAPTVDRVLARNLRVPWGLTFLPSGDALVTERVTAKVHRVRRDGGRALIGTIAGVDTDAGEGGLLGCVVSPDFAQNRHVFFYLTTQDDNRVIRMTYADGGLSDRTNILTDIERGAGTHDGGGLGFGPTGHLFISTGDTREESLAQDLDSLAGKILRLNENGSVPGGNPFGGSSPIWSYGHRNVQGFDWDGAGRMWATEFGEHTRDELNRIVAGHNYGWPDVEGGDGPGGFHDPFVTWRPTSTCSPSGVAVAQQRAWVGALAGRSLYSVRLAGPDAGQIRRHLHNQVGRIRNVRQAPDGSLWITTSNRDGRGNPIGSDDRVIRIDL